MLSMRFLIGWLVAMAIASFAVAFLLPVWFLIIWMVVAFAGSGVIGYTIGAGRPPFTGGTPETGRHAKADPPVI